MRGEINSNTVTMGEFNTSLSSIDRSSRQKVNRETGLKWYFRSGGLNIYTAFHPKTAEYIFLSSTHRIFSRIDLVLGHKVSLGKFKKIEIIPAFFLTIMLWDY